MPPALLPLVLSAALSWVDPATVRPGQTGVCVTEWTGGERLEIPVVVMGVLDAMGPDRTTVLVRLDDSRFAGTGVAAGMSGSPVYLDGTLLGAAALGWTWSRDPLVGVTPFATMRAIPVTGTTAVTPGPTLARLAAGAVGSFEPWAALPQLQVPSDARPQMLAVSGLPAPAGFATDLLTHMGLQATPGGKTPGLAGVPEPGEMIAVELVWGDAMLAAGGTVTARDGDRLWAFGHPMYGLGAVNLPVARARVLAIQGSYQTPFKVFTVGEPFGTLVADRAAGVVAIAGRVPSGTPVTVRVRDVTGDATWRFSIAEMPILQPLLVAFLANACLTARGASAGEASVKMALTVRTDDGRSVSLRQASRGPDAVPRLAVFAGTTVSFLANSPFAHPSVSAIDLVFDRKEEAEGASILESLPARTTVSPGQELTVEVRLQPQERAVERRRIAIRVPSTVPVGPLDLLVADGASWSEYRLRAEATVPADFSGQLEQLRLLESSTTLVVALEARERGVAMPGVSQPGLPPSWSVTLAAGLGSRTAARLTTAVLAAERVEVPYPLDGILRVPLTVRTGMETP